MGVVFPSKGIIRWAWLSNTAVIGVTWRIVSKAFSWARPARAATRWSLNDGICRANGLRPLIKNVGNRVGFLNTSRFAPNRRWPWK